MKNLIILFTFSVASFTLLSQVVEETLKIVDTPMHTPDSLIIYDFPDEQAQFSGGNAAIQKYIQENLVYPEEALDSNYVGKVYVQFVVETDGTLSNGKILKGQYDCLNQEAMRLINEMPSWKPGIYKGKAVRTRMVIPFIFKLD